MSDQDFRRIKRAATAHPVLDSIARRYSPYVYETRGVEPDKLRSCLEAARWAASSYNEQPWFFLVAQREDQQAFAKMLGCLVEANQIWAKRAGVLMLTGVRRQFAKNGKPNRVAEHDLGLAVGNLTLQAVELGLAVHEMGGVDLDAIRSAYQLPADHDPLTGIALGYPAASAGDADPEIASRDQAARSRKPFSEFVFGDAFGKPLWD